MLLFQPVDISGPCIATIPSRGTVVCTQQQRREGGPVLYTTEACSESGARGPLTSTGCADNTHRAPMTPACRRPRRCCARCNRTSVCSMAVSPVFPLLRSIVYTAVGNCHCQRWLTIQCPGLKCGYPGRPAYGRISLIRDSYEEGQQVAYSCDSGFNLLGQSSRGCLANGTWSGALPVCDTSLAIQRIPDTSGYLYAHPPVNALDGSKSNCFYTTHQHPRWWRVDLGAAYHVLSVAISVPHVKPAIPKPRFSEATSKIRAEYGGALRSRIHPSGPRLLNNSSDRLANVDSLPVTRARCGATQTVILMCDEGKGIVGQFVDITDKRKDPDYFSLCEVEVYVLREKYPCGDPDKPPKSYTVPISPQEMEYRCVSGYKLGGPATRSCLPSGRWSGRAPDCLELACPSLGPLENGRVAVRGASNGRTVQGSQLVYTCDPGYSLDGNDTRTCQEDARWGGQQPRCQPVTCEMPTFEMEGGSYRLLNVSTSYGDLAELNCHLGYERQGSRHTVVCQQDGTWSKPESSCTLGMVAAVIAIAFLFLLSMCVLLLLKRRKYFSGPKNHPPKAAVSATNGGTDVSYTESSGTIYQNEDFYTEIPLKPPQHDDHTVNNNHIHNGHQQPRLLYEPDVPASTADRRKSSTPSRKSSASSRENIYEEIALAASRSRKPSSGGRKSDGAAMAAPPVRERREVHSPDDSPALYAKVDFDQKRKSRMIKGGEDSVQKSPPEAGVKLRDLPPIPPPEEEGRDAVAMSLDGAVTPMASLAPHVVEGGNVYVGHPLATDGEDAVMVDNQLYVGS
ncbi:c4b-binding protein beta chain, putative [Ixodes scapularis]|uniref:C4b-binding protein beta chain, putative n=1 Tax=Ixodes scapularis TaxID=6945 RepID=B7PKL2_IXOSC|nr:c4b-binding protein beta chain, putative [Ixodes scapularis]|eukprot:XP_002400708.1 c4b-binding protein beta chain, putative [Ixodes scapularis]